MVHLNFRAGSSFPVSVCTVPSSMDRTSLCNKVDAARLYASYRFNLLLLKGQRCVNGQAGTCPVTLMPVHVQGVGPILIQIDPSPLLYTQTYIQTYRHCTQTLNNLKLDCNRLLSDIIISHINILYQDYNIRKKDYTLFCKLRILIRFNTIGAQIVFTTS